jgi:hypothetical protein
MRAAVRLWTCWLGKRVHPLRLGIESLGAAWALWPLSVLFCIFYARLTYPMDLEWCEGGILYQAYRLLHGLPVYVRDDPSWAPWSYPPLHTAVLAMVGWYDLDFWSGRLVSVAFFCALCGALFREIYVHAGRSSFGVAVGALAVATIACGFPVVGQWYDLVRVDTMMMALVVLGTARVSHPGASVARTLATAAVLTAAVYTKQTAVFFVGWVCLFAVVREPKIGFLLGVATFVMCALVLVGLQWSTDGNYWFWTFTDLKGQEVQDAGLVDGLRQTFNFAPFAALIPVGTLLLAIRGRLSARSILWVGTLLTAVPASLLPYAKVGGFLNNLMPMVMLVGPVTVLLAVDLAKRGGALGGLARWSAILGLGFFVTSRPLDSNAFVPDKTARRAAAELNALVASLKGGVVVPELAYLPARNGHTNPHWYTMAFYCALWSKRPMDMEAALLHTRARWVIMNSLDYSPFGLAVRRYYRPVRKLPPSAKVRMYTGSPIVLDELWEVRQVSAWKRVR